MQRARSARAERPEATDRLWWFVPALLIGLILIAGCSELDPALDSRVRRLDTAVLETAQGESVVRLPHVLRSDDFPRDGGRVRYRLQVDLDPAIEDPAVYVPKMGRSGRLILNDRDVGACGPRPLEELRCHQQPQYFAPAKEHWRPGINQLEFEIHATPRQMNGLSEVFVGPADPLFDGGYRVRMLWQVYVIDALSWITLGLGILSLVFHRSFRRDNLYLWFGLTCIANVLSNLNHLVTTSSLDYLLVDWFMFSTRLVYTSLLGLTYLAFFHRDRRAFVIGLCGYAFASPLVVWLTDSRSDVVSLLYLPLQLIAVVLAGASLFWAWRSRRRADWAMALTFLVMPLAGAMDLARLRGGAAFTGVYMLVYTSTITLVLVGISLAGAVAVALRSTRDFSEILERRVAEREASLREVYDRLLEMEQTRARVDERERLFRDMHDGVMSTLAVTRIALNTGRVSIEQSARYIGECLDDLRLTLAASGSATGSLEELLADFSHRYASRIEAAGWSFQFESNLEGMPGVPSSTLLQLMRIVQEAANNAIRHSGADEIHLSARWDAARRSLGIELADNGRWELAEAPREGRGMPNMRKRAAMIGADLRIDAGPDGTRVRITFDPGPG